MSNVPNLLKSGVVGFSLAVSAAVPASAEPLQGWKFDPATQQLEVTVKPGVKPRYSFMAQPARILVDLPDTEVGTVPTQEAFSGAVRSIRVTQFQPNMTRITLELAPTTVLASEQVQLQQVQESEAKSDRWLLRPLVATETASKEQVFTAMGSSTPAPTPTATLPSIPPVAPLPETRPQSSLPPDLQAALPPAPPSTFAPEQNAAPESEAPEAIPTAATAAPRSAALPAMTSSAQPRTGSSLLLSEVNPSLAIPNELPPATTPAPPSAPSVTVPPIDRSTPQTSPTVTVPPIEQPIQNNSAPVSVPPAPQNAEIPASQPRAVGRSPIIEFGQPLPTQSNAIERSSQQPQIISAVSSTTILPAGTRLMLQYPGVEALKLNNQAREEVLVLQDEIRDRSGRLIAPVGTPVYGKFETNRDGSRFIAQAITLQGQNFALVGRSDPLSGSRQMSDNSLLRNSGIGALAGVILGGLTGGLGGVALGAGATFLTSPRPATIQPGQAILLQLTEDFR